MKNIKFIIYLNLTKLTLKLEAKLLFHPLQVFDQTLWSLERRSSGFRDETFLFLIRNGQKQELPFSSKSSNHFDAVNDSGFATGDD